MLSTYEDDLPQLTEDQLGHFDRAFEWWYFDLETAEGDCLVVLFGRRNPLCSFSKQASVSVEYSHQKKKHIDIELHPAEAFKRIDSEHGTTLSLDSENYVSIQKDGPGLPLRYALSVKVGAFAAKLNFISVHQGFKPSPDGCYFQHRANRGLISSVNFAAPRMRVEGTVTLGKRPTNLKGVGYHDHPWGTDVFFNTSRQWIWGRLYNDAETILYADETAAPGYDGHLKFLYHAKIGNDRPQIDPSFQVQLLEWKPEIWSRLASGCLPGLRSFPHRHVVESRQCGLQAGARYKELLLDTPVYIRSRVEFEIAGVQTQCGCWTEYVNLPPAIGPLLLALVRVLTAIIRWNNRCYRLAGRMLG